MAIEVAKIELKSVQDASGLKACIDAGGFAAVWRDSELFADLRRPHERGREI